MASWPDTAAPRTTWQQLRGAECPVWIPDQETWLIHRPEHVEQVARDPAAFSNAVPSPRRMEHDYLLTVDGARHRQQRAAFLRYFGPRISAATATAPQTVHGVVSTLDSEDPVELVEKLCLPLGRAASRQIVGSVDETDLVRADAETLVELRRLLGNRDVPSDAGSPSSELLRRLIDDGATATVASSQVAGLLCALLVAAEDTLPAAFALALQRSLAGEKVPRRHPLAVDTPLLGLFRVCRRATSVGDIRIPAGDRLFVAWAAANHAATAHDYTFGVGVHRCPAANAVNELVTALVTCVHASLTLRLVQPVEFEPHSHVRRPRALTCTRARGSHVLD